MKFNILLSLAVATVLIGCGSGSSDSETPAAAQTPTTSTPTNTPVAIKNIAYIEGVYDISKTGDSGTDNVYLSIDSSGLIATYDYMGDTVNNGSNCYQKNRTDGYNTSINGLTVTNDEASKSFTLEGGYQWYYGDDQNISRVGIGGISAGGMLSLNNFRIATSAYLTTAVTVSEMEQLLCQ
jgi:hypothetical protein